MRDASQDRDLFAPTGSVIGVGGIDAGATGMSELVEPYLVAYLVGAEGSTLETTVLRDSLTSRLPDYMIPDKFVLLSALPVTHNGKIDRSALPLPTSTNLLRDRVGAPESVSGTDIEQRVCDLVASLLGREIGVQENFFLIGGHSMLGVQLVSQIRQAFGVKLSLRQLFSGPTVAALSVEISSRTAVVPSVAGEPS
jgi:acyl carrier protein